MTVSNENALGQNDSSFSEQFQQMYAEAERLRSEGNREAKQELHREMVVLAKKSADKRLIAEARSYVGFDAMEVGDLRLAYSELKKSVVLMYEFDEFKE